MVLERAGTGAAASSSGVEAGSKGKYFMKVMGCAMNLSVWLTCGQSFNCCSVWHA